MKLTHDQESRTRWTYYEVETALCLMEAWNDLEYCHINNQGPDEHRAAGARLSEIRGNDGSFSIRAMVASITKECNRAWAAEEALGVNHDAVAFDFDFCPRFLIDALDNGLIEQASEWQYTRDDEIKSRAWTFPLETEQSGEAN